MIKQHNRIVEMYIRIGYDNQINWFETRYNIDVDYILIADLVKKLA
jgi:hypothetical protein